MILMGNISFSVLLHCALYVLCLHVVPENVDEIKVNVFVREADYLHYENPLEIK